MKPFAVLPFLAFVALAAVIPPRAADVPASTGNRVLPRADAAVAPQDDDGRPRPPAAAASLGELLAAADEAVEDQLKLIRQYDALVESAGAVLESSDDGDFLVSTLRKTLAAAAARRNEAVKLLKNLSFVSEMCEYAASDAAADEAYLETAEPVLDMWRQALADMGYLPAAAPGVPRTNEKRLQRRPGLDDADRKRPAGGVLTKS